MESGKRGSLVSQLLIPGSKFAGGIGGGGNFVGKGEVVKFLELLPVAAEKRLMVCVLPHHLT